MKGFTVLYSYRGKLLGIFISAAGFLLLILEKLTGFILISKLDARHHQSLFLWIALFGLFLIAYSKERREDDRTKMIRLKSIQISFMLLLSVMMSISFTEIVSRQEITLGGGELLMFVAFSLMLYLLAFHLGLYADAFWEYEDKSLFENWKNIGKNKWGILAYLVICAIIYFVLNLF